MKPPRLRDLFLLAVMLTCELCSVLPPAIAADEELQQQLAENVEAMRTKLESISTAWNRGDRNHGASYLVNGELVWSDYADLSVHLKAVEWIGKHNEYGKKSTEKQARQILMDADSLLKEIRSKNTRQYQVGRQICGYISAVDGSVQPYALTLPEGIDLNRPRAKRYPLYVVLHGRGGRNEVGFMAQHRGKGPAEEQFWIQLDVFGRVDNAYRWAGETDVFEAMDDVSRRFAIDSNRVTLWGFSMGGAGAWHLAMHHPTRWASAGAGAGFVDFYTYQKQKEKLPAYQDLPLTVYDTINYARNLDEVPFVTYGGDQDKQIQTSHLMVEQAEKFEVPVKFIIGKEIGHKFTPAAEKEFQAFLAKHNQEGLAQYPGPREIQFVTYTPKYNKCHWLEIEELDEMYQESTAISKYDAESGLLDLETKNLRLVSISRGIADEISFDEEPPLSLRNAADGLLPAVYFEKREAGWEMLDYDESREYQENGSGRKRHNLQGPIDDAFMNSFVCVRGTGQPFSEAHQQWADWTLQRFQQEYSKWMRADIRVIDDKELDEETIRRSHLILFGDPGSNSVIRRISDQFPLQFTSNGYVRGEQSWDLDSHGLAMIVPNPLNSHKYIVLNSGMTMHEENFKASNSWLFPKLGDVALMKFSQKKDKMQEEVVWAELFNSEWQWQSEE